MPSDETGQLLLGHITDIASGRCSLTDDDISAEQDPVTGEILAGLLTLSEELALREQERNAAERERAEAEARNLALSTPVLDVGQQVVLMPLVGIVDLARSNLMVERALSAVSEMGARVLVIDVTGVATIDEGVAARLLATVRSVSLLGARTIVTGVSPSTCSTTLNRCWGYSVRRSRGRSAWAER